MADLSTVTGGANHSVSSLTAAEHQAAIKALSKLSSSDHGVSGSLSQSLKSATLSGGSIHSSALKLTGSVHSATAPSFSSIGSDTVVAGSAFSTKPTTASASTHSLSGDTINIAGTTAAAVKSETVHDPKAGHTLTLADKSTVTLTGVTPHDVTKPH